jgi:CBS domain-containing protein
LPVIDEGKVVGVVTDRDMYIALGTRDTRASQITVGDVATATVWTCAPTDDVHAALSTMKERASGGCLSSRAAHRRHHFL